MYKHTQMSSDRGNDRRTNLCKRRRAAAGELYISLESWPFSSSFFTLFPCIDISFYYFYCFSRHTRMYCKNSHVKISSVEVFMRLSISPKLDLGCPSSFFLFCSSLFFLRFQLARFLNTF